MATLEDIDEAEQLRFLALKSMVRKSKQNKAKIKVDEFDDPDLRLLRAAALKTITHKNHTNNGSLITTNGNNLVNGRNIKRKSLSNRLSPLKSIKNTNVKKSKYNYVADSLSNHSNLLEPSTGIVNCDPVKKPKLEVQSKPICSTKTNLKKIVRNGSMQLSNLDSDKVDETMVLNFTFSSSESDDSSSECDIKKNIIVQNNTVYGDINNGVINPQVTIKNIVDNCTRMADPISLEDNRQKVQNCLQKIGDLMRNCESEIEKRNQQLKIIWEAYEKYQNCSKSLYSILESINTVRDELSNYNSLDTITADDQFHLSQSSN